MDGNHDPPPPWRDEEVPCAIPSDGADTTRRVAEPAATHSQSHAEASRSWYIPHVAENCPGHVLPLIVAQRGKKPATSRFGQVLTDEGRHLDCEEGPHILRDVEMGRGRPRIAVLLGDLCRAALCALCAGARRSLRLRTLASSRTPLVPLRFTSSSGRAARDLSWPRGMILAPSTVIPTDEGLAHRPCRRHIMLRIRASGEHVQRAALVSRPRRCRGDVPPPAPSAPRGACSSTRRPLWPGDQLSVLAVCPLEHITTA
jgi:hypothetical protein